MRICLIVYDISVVGGVEKVTVSLANELVVSNEVFVLSLHGDSCTHNLDAKVRVDYLGTPSLRLRKERKELKRPLSKYVNDNKIDVVILQGHKVAFSCNTLHFTTNKKIIFCDHGAIMNNWSNKSLVFIRWFDSVMSDATVVLTERSKCAYHKKLFISNSKLTVIPNWIDNIHNSMQYDIESKKIISVGRLSEEKGFDRLILAYKQIASKYPEWSLDIYGSGEKFQELQQMIIDGQLSNSVFLKGEKNITNQLYNQYSFYVLPSYKEGFPVVLLEAKYNKLPIVSFDIISGPREIIRDGIDGILVESGDLTSFAEAMEKLITSSSLRKKMSDNSQENIQKFSKNSIIKDWNELLLRIMNNK